jgi:hypothetical protein
VGVALAALLGALWLIGRPASMDSAAVTREASAMTSTIAEAQLLATIVADGRGVDRATKAHAAELAESLEKSSTLLTTSKLPSDTTKPVASLVEIASKASDDLAELQAHAGDRTRASKLERHLGQLGDAADKPAKQVGA